MCGRQSRRIPNGKRLSRLMKKSRSLCGCLIFSRRQVSSRWSQRSKDWRLHFFIPQNIGMIIHIFYFRSFQCRSRRKICVVTGPTPLNSCSLFSKSFLFFACFNKFVAVLYFSFKVLQTSSSLVAVEKS